MNDQLKYSLAGFCMGVAELIPGISGSTVAVIFKIYPNLMSILSQLRLKNFSLNFSLTSKIFQFGVSLPLIFSMIAAILLCSNLITFLINNYEQLFLSLLGWLMMFLSVYVADFFRSSLIIAITDKAEQIIIERPVPRPLKPSNILIPTN